MTEMKDVDHTHPHDDPATQRLFSRGRVAVADGGTADSVSDEQDDRMEEVDHEGGDDTEGVARAFERGDAGAVDTNE